MERSGLRAGSALHIRPKSAVKEFGWGAAESAQSTVQMKASVCDRRWWCQTSRCAVVRWANEWSLASRGVISRRGRYGAIVVLLAVVVVTVSVVGCGAGGGDGGVGDQEPLYSLI